MILYQPQLVLVPTADNKLFLHSTTFFDTVNVQPKGHKVKRKLKDGVLKVELYVITDNNFPEEVLEMKCINPVVHHVDLGDILEVGADGELNGEVEATVYFKSNARSGGRRKAGSSTVRSTSNGSSSRPNPKKG